MTTLHNHGYFFRLRVVANYVCEILYHFDQFSPNWEILHFRKISKYRINPKKIKSGVKKKGRDA